jgi:hypothetical protein
MGFYSAGFQYARKFPWVRVGSDFRSPALEVQNVSTDAILLLTIYPMDGPWNITDDQIQGLGDHMNEIAKNGSRGIISKSHEFKALIRFAPEMNGNWNPFGQQPVEYVALWRRVYTIVKKASPSTGTFHLIYVQVSFGVLIQATAIRS